MAIGLAFHTLAAVLWVGGMFFALMVLRPSTLALEPAIRLKLWHGVFSRFFPWVWLFIAVLLISGFAMLFWGLGGFGARPSVDAMTALGLVMVAIYSHLYFALWQHFRRAVTINLALGIATVMIGAGGGYWGQALRRP